MKKLVGIRQGLGIDVGLKEDIALIYMGNEPIFDKGSMEDWCLVHVTM